MIKRRDKSEMVKVGRNSTKKELKSIPIYVVGIENEALKGRVEHILDWYIRKAASYKRLFYGISAVLILINASIPIINEIGIENIGFTGKDITVSIISSIATILTSFMTLFTMKDTWFRYRKHVESIKTECMLFNCKCEPYNDKNRECNFAQKIESIICNERQQWINNKFDNKTNQDNAVNENA
ncbi:hypothetical protein CDLVIII_3815 [Clostridium sp. DL-VIII]|uniref:DUF4231 domain-containing protein n=1 Tax=Clostridium sp. DL-VIII TaxID=641107 RepID=UPI00023AFFD9|nr:DUF4231 domain-containing protein [Clostridium sp. DL-VIII]EHJ00364.1 hypothetical protein CDLVIII_3815 [Clostridium sp. DL-VIII]